MFLANTVIILHENTIWMHKVNITGHELMKFIGNLFLYCGEILNPKK